MSKNHDRIKKVALEISSLIEFTRQPQLMDALWKGAPPKRGIL